MAVYNHNQMTAYVASLIDDYRLNNSSQKSLYAKLDGIPPTEIGRTALERMAKFLVELETDSGERQTKTFVQLKSVRSPRHSDKSDARKGKRIRKESEQS